MSAATITRPTTMSAATITRPTTPTPNTPAVLLTRQCQTAGPISAPMVAALEDAWAAIRARHPEVPAVVIILGAGSGSGSSLEAAAGHLVVRVVALEEEWFPGVRARNAVVALGRQKLTSVMPGDNARNWYQSLSVTPT